MTIIEKILVELCAKDIVEDGIPDFTNEKHLLALNKVLVELNWPMEARGELLYKLMEKDDKEPPLDDMEKDKAKKMGLVWKGKGYGKENEKGISYKNDGGKLVKIDKDDAGQDSSPTKLKAKDGDFDRDSSINNKTEPPKAVKNIFNGTQNSVRDGLLYMSAEDKKLFDDFKTDFQELSENPSKELAQQMVDKYGLEVSSGAKPKVYMRNINFEARKILGQNKATTFIKDTVEGALGEPLKGAEKGVDVKQAVTTTSKPDLETKRTAKEDENVKELFQKEPYDRLNPNFHQVFGPVGKDGNLIYPSGGKNAKEYLKQSLSENNSIKRTIERLKELEKSDNVSPKIREALESHQKNMESILDKYTVPSEEAAQAIGDSYAKMAETINVESPTIAGAMMKNLAEFALYDTEIAKGDECYLPSDGSFPSGDKLKVTRDGGKVERVASVSVKYGRSGKFGSFGFPGETGQYQKYHPNPEYRDRLHSRPGDTGYELGVKDDIVNSDEQMNKIIEESGLGPAIKDNKKLLNVIRENLNEIKKLKEEIEFEQKPKRKSGKPPAWKQLNVHKKRILELEQRLSKELKDAVDEEKLKELVGSDNAKLMMSRPGCMVTGLTFASTLTTSNGLDVIEHNHQEIKDGKYKSHTDTAEDGTQNLKNWKLTWRAWDSRAGGMIASFNSDRKEYEA